LKGRNLFRGGVQDGLENTAAPVWADTAYRSARNEAFLARHGRTSKVQFCRQPGKPLSAAQTKANAARAGVRGHIEHVFAVQKAHMGLFSHTIGLARARTKTGLANLTCNFRRLTWLDRRSVPA
jgi:IS5 family transposase